jgi:hypothetical protein
MAKLPLVWPLLNIGEIYVYKKIKLTEGKPFAFADSDSAKMHMSSLLDEVDALPDLSSLLYQHERTQAHRVLHSHN